MDIYTKGKKLYAIEIYENHATWIAEVTPLNHPTAEPIFIEGQDIRAIDLSLLREGFEPVA